MAKYGKKASEKVEKSEARKEGGKVPRKKSSSKKKSSKKK